jgi:hypothetical protein
VVPVVVAGEEVLVVEEEVGVGEGVAVDFELARLDEMVMRLDTGSHGPYSR